jgi:16S rRNA (adenine1518-N6/adenine1519-N6)-dimethyltransferase
MSPLPTGRPPARRRWGQHFLKDAAAAERLIRLFGIDGEDRVVEIGPGAGALTVPLARRAARLVALEIDPARVPLLERTLEPWPHAEVRGADAVEVDWSALAAELGPPVRIVGNLPYNVGTAIVRRLLASRGLADVQVVLQREVVDRILSPPGTKSYGPISVLAALRGDRTGLADLSPGVFRPMPKVWSKAVRLTPRDDAPLGPDEVDWLEDWLFAGFRHRRKTLAGNLAEAKQVVGDLLEEAGLPRDARAEALPPGVWLDLARRLEAGRAGGENL